MTKSFCFLVFLFFVSNFSFGQILPEDQIREVYKNYSGAISVCDGKEAIKYLDSRSANYYNRILKFVKTADSVTISTMSLVDKSTVLLFRNMLTKEELKSFEGLSLMAYLIDRKLGGRALLLSDLVVNGDSATGHIIGSGGQTTPQYPLFYKENDEWKIDITALFPISEPYMKKMVDKNFSGNENAFCLMVAGASNRKIPGREIWQPME